MSSSSSSSCTEACSSAAQCSSSSTRVIGTTETSEFVQRTAIANGQQLMRATGNIMSKEDAPLLEDFDVNYVMPSGPASYFISRWYTQNIDKVEKCKDPTMEVDMNMGYTSDGKSLTEKRGKIKIKLPMNKPDALKKMLAAIQAWEEEEHHITVWRKFLEVEDERVVGVCWLCEWNQGFTHFRLFSNFTSN